MSTVCYWKWPKSKHRISWFTHLRWWFAMVMLVYQRICMFFMFCMTWGVLPTQLEVGCGFIRWTSEILNYLAHYLAHAIFQRPMSIIYIYNGVLNFHPHPRKAPEFSWTGGWSIASRIAMNQCSIEGCFAAVAANFAPEERSSCSSSASTSRDFTIYIARSS
jgi:hypothetical protein